MPVSKLLPLLVKAGRIKESDVKPVMQMIAKKKKKTEKFLETEWADFLYKQEKIWT